MQLTLSQKLKLAQVGKKLNSEDIELKAIKKYGIKKYRKDLADKFDVTESFISMAFNRKAPSMLARIKELVS
jgi:hypothetical protein